MEKLQRTIQCKIVLLIFSFIPKNFNAFVIIESEERLCIELYKNIKSLGRVTLRAGGETLAAGVVMDFLV